MPGPGEVLVRVGAAGLCSTDIHIWKGKLPTVTLPRITGHEGAGTVVEVGPAVEGIAVGDRVTISIYVTCDRCFHCRRGEENLCLHKVRIGFERDGSHAGLVSVPAQNVVHLPANVSLEEACILPDAVACMLHAIRTRGGVRAGDTVVILGGAGGLGMQGVQIARLCGARVVATSRRDDKLAAVAELAAIPVNPARHDLPGIVRELTEGRGVDVVIDNIGLPQSVDLAVSLLRRGGRAVVVGYQGEQFSGPFYDLVMGEKEIVGALAATKQDLRDAVTFVAEGRLRPVIAASYPLAAINDALSRLATMDVAGRIVLIPEAA
ncbi:MAG: alcohol dehydrogenase catalytic domain-containing protein [Chloroflexota bacterium]|nr:alcohol dehydrogenase catalytic domain-containing protein [Chloroflexota bacterium]